MATKRRKRCSDCGELGATERQVDCADEVHWFHAECLGKFAAWIRCEAGVETKRGYTCAGAMAPADDRNEPDHDASENAKAGAVAWKAITDGEVVNALLAVDGVKRRGKRRKV